MTVRIKTGQSIRLDRSSSWWNNFLDQRENGWDRVGDINIELAKWNAQWIRPRHSGEPPELEFPCEEDKMLFLLRWA